MEIRNATPADLVDLRLFSDQYDRPDSSTFSEDIFTWQFEDAAALAGAGDNGVLLCVEGGKIISMVVGSKTPVYVDGQSTSGVWQFAWFTDSAYRGAGFFLMKEQISRNAFVGTAGQTIDAACSRPESRPMVWFELDRLFAVIIVDACCDLLFSKSEMSRRYLTLQNLAKPSGPTRRRPVDRFSDQYDETWGKFRQGILFCTDRTSRYMNWRYVDHPRFRYERMEVSTPHGNAYFVWREEPVQEKGITVARICEVIGDDAAIMDGFSSLFGVLEEKNIAVADFFCSHGSTNAALMEAGMRPVITTEDFDLPRLFQPLANDVRKRINFGYSFSDTTRPDHLYNHHLTYITKGDGNQDRPNP